MPTTKAHNAKTMRNKVPGITIFFWIIKVLCTTVGETASDFLNETLGFGLVGTSIVVGALLAVAMFLQFRARKYIAGLYWLNVALVSVFGTLVTDSLTDGLGVPLELSTIVFSVLLLAVFALWYKSEKTLSIHSIFTTKREAFYWLTVLCTFALGTAAGDLLAEGLGLGYLTTGIIVVSVIAVAGIAWKLGMDAVLSFWLIYVMTRPLGASLGDLLSQSKENGGLGLGATWTSVIFLAAILGTVLYLAVSRRDLNRETEDAPAQKSHKALGQTLAVVCVFALLSGGGYALRLRQIAKNPEKAPYSWADLSEFRGIEEDVLALVRQGKLADAKAEVKELEMTWDGARVFLKTMDKDRWTQADIAIDAVLSALRARQPDAAACVAALEDSMAMMQ